MLLRANKFRKDKESDCRRNELGSRIFMGRVLAIMRNVCIFYPSFAYGLIIAGQSHGVVCAPRRSQLPAVRAVSEICEGVPKAAKNSRRALQYEKSTPFQGKRRGSNEICEVNTKNGKRKKQNSRSGSRRSASSLLTTAMRTINARAAANTSKKQSGFIPVSYMRKKLTANSPKPCSRSYPERWIGSQNASGGSFSSWQSSRTSTIISSLRIRTLTPGAIRKCADLVWMKSKERMGKSILRTHC